MYRIFKIKPRNLALEASTVCHLKCPTCPNAEGKIASNLGSGFLKFTDFKNTLDNNAYVKNVLMSNYGEPFLNPEIITMVEYAYENGVNLSAFSNMNAVTRPLAEALVKYQFRCLTCSIDGVDNDSYSAYRRGGNFERVIDNIEMINEFKRQYSTRYPQLVWQFVPFGHNEELISVARKMAQDLDMDFIVKLAWGDLYGSEPFSPVKNKELVSAESGLGAASKEEYYQKFGGSYRRDMCTLMWVEPFVTFNGRVLGCCVNFWGDYGNAFRDGLLKTLNNEKMNYARAMLTGKKPPRNDIPCTTCTYYNIMKTDHHWVSKDEILTLSPRLVNRLRSGLIKMQRKASRPTAK